MKKILLIATMMIVIAGCRNEGVSTEATENVNYKVTTLFSHEGCTVYRFYDAETVYYVNCGGANASTQWRRSCGKSCYREEGVETGEAQ